jgi:AcrR family transcriptional regulator
VTDGALTAEEILVAAEDVLRRFGPEKANVVDVARALGVSHGTVYRHFASKAELRDAVMHRWLARIADPLAAIAASDVAPPLRLREWFTTLRRLKRAKAGDEPELFATYNALASDARDVVGAHVAELTAQVARILRDGVSAGVFTVADPELTAAAIVSATQRFHHPVHAGDWGTPENDAAFEAVWSLLERALRPGPG